MKLLILTQTVDRNDPVLGFFHGWIAEFAQRCESVTVLCLRKGETDLPSSVRIMTLPRGRVARAFAVVSHAFAERRTYTQVFVHMNPEYLVVAGWLWKVLSKKTVLWYAHRQVHVKLRVALFFADAVATPARESFGVASTKVHVMGHGIDTELFRGPIPPALRTPLSIISAGRITPIKHLEVAIEALARLRKRGIEARLTLVGAPTVPSDTAYERALHERISSRGLNDSVAFMGAVPYEKMPQEYARHDISLNLCPTGGLDKAVIESMAAGLLVIVSNRAFLPLLGSLSNELMPRERDVDDVARILATISTLPSGRTVGMRKELQRQAEGMSVRNLIPRLLTLYETSR